MLHLRCSVFAEFGAGLMLRSTISSVIVFFERTPFHAVKDS